MSQEINFLFKNGFYQMRIVLNRSKIEISDRSKLSEIGLPTSVLIWRGILPVISLP